jgi:hypothetical protein
MRDTKPLPHPGNLRDVVSLAKTPNLSFGLRMDGHFLWPVEVKVLRVLERFPNSTKRGTRKTPQQDILFRETIQ